MMEIDALYPSTLLRAVSLSSRCDVIVKRREQFAGQKADRMEAPEVTASAEG